MAVRLDGERRDDERRGRRRDWELKPSEPRGRTGEQEPGRDNMRPDPANSDAESKARSRPGELYCADCFAVRMANREFRAQSTDSLRRDFTACGGAERRQASQARDELRGRAARVQRTGKARARIGHRRGNPKLRPAGHRAEVRRTQGDGRRELEADWSTTTRRGEPRLGDAPRGAWPERKFELGRCRGWAEDGLELETSSVGT
jgi:hypothetical protein